MLFLELGTWTTSDLNVFQDWLLYKHYYVDTDITDSRLRLVKAFNNECIEIIDKLTIHLIFLKDPHAFQRLSFTLSSVEGYPLI